MNNKPYIISFFLALWLSYGLVLAWVWEKEDDFYSSSTNIFLDSKDLNKNQIFIKSNSDSEQFFISWDCKAQWKLVEKKSNLYTYDLIINDKNCAKKDISVYIKKENKNIKTFKFYIFREYKLYSLFLDFKNEYLEKIQKTLLKKDLKKLKNRTLEEKKYLYNFIKNILEKRKEKYKIPVLWAELPSRFTKMPNSPRPYRSAYTDNFHHWWDFDSEKWAMVVALDDGIIVRIVKGFKFSDLDKIDYSKKLSYEQRLENLDILRWNQVWLKTMKGDVAFYSHLDSILENVKIWTIIKKWEAIWRVGITWVPDRDYTDSHLHIPIQKNPYILKKAWKYNYMDYMAWSWYLKWKSYSEVLKNQENVFEK